MRFLIIIHVQLFLEMSPILIEECIHNEYGWSKQRSLTHACNQTTYVRLLHRNTRLLWSTFKV